ncbi:MmgE/PrpD family protein [Arthrobacter sp. ISL-65]|uniref:MmgE/PrpD family protein n=1 Tax=Arthrobacter sp. ISL-65 TaxID=2819112 RepID=UPI001BE5BEC4|nr:MmgE/PrpD family protein [Arthrobacter sp. ISL-65]MBT2547228.1 MmgE/PrpD family protein [Arthrobacter sp. ISL-65]
MNPGQAALGGFIHDLRASELPAAVMHQARRCLLDLIGVAAAGTGTGMSRILRDHAHELSGHARIASRLMFDGRSVGASHAALVNAGTIDSLDGHDGHRQTKGHAGAAILPAVLAFIDQTTGQTVEEMLTALVIGYEIALRAGLALHRTAADYHSSGAWNAIGAAAVGARLLGLGHDATLDALGIAEFSAPRGPMMRSIAHPTMVKDSTAWGAEAGVSAAFLASRGFTGAPAELLTNAPEARDLGSRWLITEQYFKPYPVCRWAHPAIQAAQTLIGEGLGGPATDNIASVEVITFDAATRLHTTAPTTTEQAQYSLPFSLAAAIVHGNVKAEHVLTPQDQNAVLELAAKVRLTASPAITNDFPALRRARVVISYKDGRVQSTPLTQADGDPEAPLADPALTAKYRANTSALGHERSISIADLVFSSQDEDTSALTDLLMAPVGPASAAAAAS